MEKKKTLGIVVAIIVIIAAYFVYDHIASGSGSANWPSRTINIYVASSAGGGTDVWNRQLASEIEKELGTSVVVSNLPDGGGSAAQVNTWNAEHDGYSWLGVSETGCMWPAIGNSTQTSKDWTYFVMAGSPGVICVPGDSPYETWGDFIEAAKANPGKLNMANSGTGKLWHLKAYVALECGNIDVNHIPYSGSGKAIIGLLSNEADAITLSVAEASEYILSGEMRPLVMTENEAFNIEGYGEVEPVTNYYADAAEYYPLNQFLSFALPADTDPEILRIIEEAYHKVMDSDSIKKFAEEQMATLYALSGEEADEMVSNMESTLCFLLKDLGLATADFESLGITAQ